MAEFFYISKALVSHLIELIEVNKEGSCNKWENTCKHLAQNLVHRRQSLTGNLLKYSNRCRRLLFPGLTLWVSVRPRNLNFQCIPWVSPGRWSLNWQILPGTCWRNQIKCWVIPLSSKRRIYGLVKNHYEYIGFFIGFTLSFCLLQHRVQSEPGTVGPHLPREQEDHMTRKLRAEPRGRHKFRGTYIYIFFFFLSFLS